MRDPCGCVGGSGTVGGVTEMQASSAGGVR